MRLAHAARAEQDRVLAALDVIAACEVQHQHLVEARDGLEVEALELLASATATSFRGLRASMRASHEPSGAPRRTACWMTDIAPTTNRRLRSRWPIFDILPSLGLPPVVCWRGTRPSQAEKSRPRRKLSIGGAKACIADAQIGPMPGMVISRLASSSWRAFARVSFSRPLISASCAGYAFELIFKVMVRVRGGQPEPKHEPSEAYRKLAELAPGDCTEVKRIITSHGWKDASEFLTYLDEHLCDKDRKYWMKPPKGGAAGATPICPTGPFSMPPTGCRTAFVWPWPEAGRVGRVRSCRRLTSPRA